MPSICVITPTIGRPTLKNALLSARPDEWVVVGDGRQPEAERIVDELNLPYVHYLQGYRTGNTGNTQRDLAILIARFQYIADYFLFLDDDDEFTPGAMDMVRSHLQGLPVMFRMISNGETIWRERLLTIGNIGGSMFCAPNEPGKLARWDNGNGHHSDFVFIEETLKHWPDLIWAGEVIVRCKPDVV